MILTFKQQLLNLVNNIPDSLETTDPSLPSDFEHNLDMTVAFLTFCTRINNE